MRGVIPVLVLLCLGATPTQELALLQLVDYDPELCEAAVYVDGETIELPPGTLLEGPPGELEVLVLNEHGVVEVPLVLREGQTLTFDPTPARAGRIRVTGLVGRAGLNLWGLSRWSVWNRRSLAPITAVDRSRGTLEGGDAVFGDVQPGLVGLLVIHPHAGRRLAEVELAPGESLTLTVDYRSGRELEAMNLRFQRWRDDIRQIRRRNLPPILLSALGACLGGTAAVLFMGQARSAGSDAEWARSQAQAEHDWDYNADLPYWEALHEDGIRRERQAMAGATVGFAVAGAGLVVSVAFGLRQRTQVLELGAWADVLEEDAP
jgi:hypothetical protein